MNNAVPPETLSKRYILHEILGSGGMGTVFRATDRLTGNTVALKRIRIHSDQLTFGGNDERFDSRLALAQEFRMLASLRHPNIISVLDYGFDEQRQPFFTMDLLENAVDVVQFGRNKSAETK